MRCAFSAPASKAAIAASSAAARAAGRGGGTGISFKACNSSPVIPSVHRLQICLEPLLRFVQLPGYSLFLAAHDARSLGVAHVLAINQKHGVALLGWQAVHGQPQFRVHDAILW